MYTHSFRFVTLVKISHEWRSMWSNSKACKIRLKHTKWATVTIYQQNLVPSFFVRHLKESGNFWIAHCV
jgi:hypothetical protein